MEKGIDLVKLTMTEDGRLFVGIYNQLRENLSEAQLESIWDYADEIARVVREVNTTMGELN